ncbi:uncharacterized protein LOC110450644 [Mizuhopecten yessoensis]|nr:uncharacterized protein LOC110450644 [Mizuhopecten yessoensis]XP_021353941.1 uncharacterized protein LOC110450644 [Mizuhopecten yessoensis]
MEQSKGTEKMETEDVEMEERVDLITEDWAFNVTLSNIASEITPEELKRMKHLTKGTNGLGKAVLEKIKDATDLFDIMRDRACLDPNNWLHLQALLWTIGRKDLCGTLANFARNDRKQPLYFFPPKEQPENGYTFLKFHIAGTNTSKQDVRNLRNLVAELLLTPVEYVYFVGYEPSSSIIVTFMVPTDNTRELKALSEEDRSLLKSMHVDYIFIGEEEVSIIGERYKPPVTLSSIKEITKFMREKKRLERELQDSLALSLQRHKALKQEQQRILGLELTINRQAIALSYCMSEIIPKQLPVDSMDQCSVLTYFRQTLEKFFEKFPEKREDVYVLLEAKELITRKLERHKWRAFSTAQHLSNLSSQTALAVNYATRTEQLHTTTSGKLPATLVEEPYPWQNLNIHQTVLQMPVVSWGVPQPPPQQPPTPQNPYQLSTTQIPQTPYFGFKGDVPSASSYPNQFRFGGEKVTTPVFGTGFMKGYQNTKQPILTTVGSTARPNGSSASHSQQHDQRPSYIKDASNSECLRKFMRDASLKLNEAQRKSLINQTELNSDRREEAQKHPENLFQVLYEDEQSTSSEEVDIIKFVLEKASSLSEPELLKEIDMLFREVYQEQGMRQQISISSSQYVIMPTNKA